MSLEAPIGGGEVRKGRGPLEGVLMNGLLRLQLGLSPAGPHGNTVDSTQIQSCPTQGQGS